MDWTCTLCKEQVAPDDAVYGIDYPQCGPVHHDCADYNDWLYFNARNVEA